MNSGVLERDFSTSNSAPGDSNAKFTCPICFDEKTLCQGFQLTACTHHMCYECAGRMARVQLTVQVRCPLCRCLESRTPEAAPEQDTHDGDNTDDDDEEVFADESHHNGDNRDNKLRIILSIKKFVINVGSRA
jgi:hypothetical protein